MYFTKDLELCKNGIPKSSSKQKTLKKKASFDLEGKKGSHESKFAKWISFGLKYAVEVDYIGFNALCRMKTLKEAFDRHFGFSQKYFESSLYKKDASPLGVSVHVQTGFQIGQSLDGLNCGLAETLGADRRFIFHANCLYENHDIADNVSFSKELLNWVESTISSDCIKERKDYKDRKGISFSITYDQFFDLYSTIMVNYDMFETYNYVACNFSKDYRVDKGVQTLDFATLMTMITDEFSLEDHELLCDYRILGKDAALHVDAKKSMKTSFDASDLPQYSVEPLGGYVSVVDLMGDISRIDEGWECGYLTTREGDKYFYLTHPVYDEPDGDYADDGENVPIDLDEEMKEFTYAKSFDNFIATLA